jgi:hypothetical protein
VGKRKTVITPAQNRPASKRYVIGCAILVLAVPTFFGSGITFITSIVNPSWPPRLFGVQTQGVVTSVDADACIPVYDPNPDLPTGSDGGNIGGNLALAQLPRLAVQTDVLPTVQFTDRQGHSHELQETFCGTYGVGQQVTVYYLPNDPTTFSLAQDTDAQVVPMYGSIIGMLLSLLALLGSVGSMLVFAALGRRAARKAALSSVGSPQTSWGQPGGGKSKPHRLGQAVTVEGRWSVTPTHAYPWQGDARVHPAPGRSYLMLSTTLRNVSREPLSPGQAMFRLYNGLWTEYQRVQTLESPRAGHLQPGASVSLTLAFDVPATQRQFRLSYDSSSSLLTQASWDIAA